MRYLLLLISILAAPIVAAPLLQVRVRTERPPETGVITIADISFGSDAYSMVLPQKWRFEPDLGSSTMRLQAETDRAHITVQFSAQLPQAALQSAETLRQFVAPNLSSARVLEDFPVHSATGEGKGAVFAYGVNMRCRAAVIPTTRGCAIFLLSCKTDEMAGEQAYGALLSSFRAIAAPPAAR